MSVIATITRRTAIAGVRRRGRSDHPYRSDLGVVVPLRRMGGRTVEDAAAVLVDELTARDGAAGRECSTISARRGMADVIALVARGYRMLSLADVAAIAGVSLRTAWSAMHQLRAAGVLWAHRLGRKGESVTCWALGKRGAALLDQALSRVAGWVKARAAARDRWRNSQRANASRSQHATSAHRVTPPGVTTGSAPPRFDRGRVFGTAGDECEHGAAPHRCALCRRRRQ